MPSPFPGMDPYLEGALFHDVHQRLASEISDQLTPQIAPAYVARLATYYLATHGGAAGGVRIVYPDVDVARAKAEADNGKTIREAAISYDLDQRPKAAQVTPPLLVPVWQLHDIELVTVEIRDSAGNELVTAIEILSPANKHQPSFGQYHEKRLAYLRSQVNLLEVDLLRDGLRPVEIESIPATPYYVFLSRATDRDHIAIWPIPLANSLPVVAVPLRPQDGDALLDLGAALASIYDRARYDLSIDYRQPPEPPLDGDEAAWAATIIQP